MRIQIDVRWPRFLRERPRWARLTIVAIIAAGVLAVPIAWANHDFTDVPTASPFHTAISAVKSAGITAGKTCVPPGTPPTYCPSENITREAMAAFVQRGMGRSDIDQSTAPPTISSAALTVLNLDDITVGGVSGQQFIRAEGWLTTDDGPFTGNFCELYAQLTMDEGTANEQVSNFSTIAMDSSNNANVDQTLYMSWLFPAVTSGTHIIRFKAGKNSGCATADGSIQLLDSQLLLQTFAFNDDADGGVGVENPPAGPAPTRPDPAGH